MAWGDTIQLDPDQPTDTPIELDGVTVQEYNAIRALLLVNLKETDLSNTVISDRTYFGAAKDEIDRRLGSHLAVILLDPEKELKYRRAVSLLTASYLCLAVPQLDSDGLESIRRSWHQTDWAAKKQMLEMRANAAIAELLPIATRLISASSVLRGRRGRF